MWHYYNHNQWNLFNPEHQKYINLDYKKYINNKLKNTSKFKSFIINFDTMNMYYHKTAKTYKVHNFNSVNPQSFPSNSSKKIFIGNQKKGFPHYKPKPIGKQIWNNQFKGAVPKDQHSTVFYPDSSLSSIHTMITSSPSTRSIKYNNADNVTLPVLSKDDVKYLDKIARSDKLESIQFYLEKFDVNISLETIKNLHPFTKQQIIEILQYCAQCCIELNQVFKGPIGVLRQSHNKLVVLTQYQCCCLLSLAFFNLIPLQHNNTVFNMSGRNKNQKFSFKLWHNKPNYLKCLFAYFHVMTKRTNKNQLHVIFERVQENNRKIKTREAFKKVDVKYNTKAEYISNRNVIQGICTDTYLGSKMLTEKHFLFTDIRFLISPECLLTFLLYEPLSENVNECIHIRGIDYYSRTEKNVIFKNVFNRKDATIENDTEIVKIQSKEFRALEYAIIIYQPKRNHLKTEKFTEDIDRFIPVFKSNVKQKKYAFNCCACGDATIDPQLRFIEQWITASMFNIDMICCIRK